MPGILPRLKDLLFTGFGPVTQLVALICFMVGLLPKNHPCFAKKTKNDYGLLKILAAAANNVKFEWKHSDQIIIFTAILCGTVMLYLYLLGLIFFVVVSPASALGLAIADAFVTRAPNKDVAFMMLDRVFGIPGIFNSCISAGAACFNIPVAAGSPPIPFPTPFQAAMLELFRFFSMGIFFIALFIFLFYIMEIVFDITQTGHVAEHLSDGEEGSGRNFGWLPVRFVVCFGLLLPFGNGLNSAQWITLYAAKYGSGLATNAWINYNLQTGQNPTGEQNINLVAKPNPLDTSGLIKSLFLLRSCIEMNYWEYDPNNTANNGSHFVRGYIVNGNQSKALFRTMDERSHYVDITSGNYFMENQKNYNATASTIANGSAGDHFIQMLQFSGMGDIQLILGTLDENNPEQYKNYPGGVLPVCGQITIPVTGLTGEALFASEGYLFAVLNILFEVNRPGIGLTPFEDNLYIAVLREYNRSSSLMKSFLEDRQASRLASGANTACWYDDNNDNFDSLDESAESGDYLGHCLKPVPSSYWTKLMNDYFKYAFAVSPYSAYDFLAGTATAEAYDGGVYAIKSAAWNSVGKPNPLLMSAGILEYGWGGAGLWYNKISERNGSLYTATTSLPLIRKFPMVMEDIKSARQKTDTGVGNSFCETYNPRKSGTGSTHQPAEKNQFVAEEAAALHSLCTQLYDNQGIILYDENGAGDRQITRTTPANNPIEAAISSLFSEFKVFDPQKNYEVTPMAQMAAIGRALMDKAIFGVIASTTFSAVGGAAHIASAGGVGGADVVGDVSGAAAGVMMTFAIIALTSGVLLHYILPFMPFVYFFFAVGRWVKVIFEAMVGVPLWALAHMRTGGPGLPGNAASAGYFLILEIFIRPIVTVFSLVASFALFSAIAVGLNSLFALVSVNLFGVTPANNVYVIDLARGAVDQFFLSCFYIMLVYMIGTGCFKLIDVIPDGILRWSGQGVQSMGAADISDDLIDEWQWQIPMRTQSLAQEGGAATRELLYNPGKKMGDAKKAKDAQEAAAAEEKAAQASKAASQTDNGG